MSLRTWVARPPVHISSRMVRDAIADALPGVVITPALASGLRAVLESLGSELVSSSALHASGLALTPRHLQMAVSSDADLLRAFPDFVGGVGAVDHDTAIALVPALRRGASGRNERF